LILGAVGAHHLDAVADADGEDQERHQDAHRVDAVAEEGEDAELPDHRRERAGQRDDAELDRLRVDVDEDGGDQEGDAEEQHHAVGAVGDVADHLGEADHVDVDHRGLDHDVDAVAVAAPDLFFELPRDVDVVERRAGVGVDLLQLGADDGARKVVGHQAADDARLQDVLAHLRQAFRRRPEIRGHHVAARDAVLDDLGEARVGGHQRAHLGAVDAGNEEHLVGDRLQRREELRGEDVAFPGHQRDQDAVGAGGEGHPRGGVVDALGIRGAAARRVDLHLEGLVGLEHRLVAGGELVGVVVHVGRGDGEEHPVGGEGIRMVVAGLVTRRRRRDAAFPRRDGAVRVAGALGADRRQVLAQSRGLLRRDLGPGRRRGRGEHE
jgi:hypothetical protein